jgi:hypothetical protein
VLFLNGFLLGKHQPAATSRQPPLLRPGDSGSAAAQAASLLLLPPGGYYSRIYSSRYVYVAAVSRRLVPSAMAGLDVVSSSSSRLVKHLLRLASQPRYAARCQTALVAGSQRVVGDVLSASGEPPLKLVLPIETGRGGRGQELHSHSLAGHRATHLATPAILQSLCGVSRLEPGRGAVAELALPPQPSLRTCEGWGRLLVLDGVSDPGNVGALMRAAYGLGWDGVLLAEVRCGWLRRVPRLATSVYLSILWVSVKSPA